MVVENHRRGEPAAPGQRLRHGGGLQRGAGQHPHPLPPALVADFPAGCDEWRPARLPTVLVHWPIRVHVLLHQDPAQAAGRAWIRLPCGARRSRWTLARPNCACRPRTWQRDCWCGRMPCLWRQGQRLVGGRCQSGGPVLSSTLPFQRLAIAADQRWRGDSTDGLVVPVGVTGQGEVWRLAMGETGKTNHHGLVVGMPGSGKSNLLHVLICQLTQRYAPQELELYLLDFREGVDSSRTARCRMCGRLPWRASGSSP